MLLALAAVVVSAMAPDSSEDRSDDIRQALADYEANETQSSGAPQQQVVNGWVAKDLLTIIAGQQNDTATDDRLPALSVIAVLGPALHIATTPRPAGLPRVIRWGRHGGRRSRPRTADARPTSWDPMYGTAHPAEKNGPPAYDGWIVRR